MRFFFFLLATLVATQAIDVKLPIPLPIPLPIDIPLPDLEDLNPLKIGQLFKQFIDGFKKTYASPEAYANALKSFGENAKKIVQLQKLTKGQGVEFGINQFSDLTKDQFRQLFLIPKPEESGIPLYNMTRFQQTVTKYGSLPDWDWRGNKNVVSPIKNQGSCGSCWAFATAAVITGANGIKNSNLVEPSEQQITDCSGPADRAGCNGGWVDRGLKYAKDNGVSPTGGYTAYNPSRATKTGVCDHAGKPNNIRISDYGRIYPSDAVKLQDAVYWKGPIGVAFAVGDSFQHYKSGVYNQQDCYEEGVGWHAVAIVGYGTDNGQKFWIAKNSWSTGWGEQGFFRFAKGSDLCHMESDQVYFAVGK